MLKPIAAVLAAALALSGCATMPATKAACTPSPTNVWVVVDGIGQCVRYFPAGLPAAPGARDAVVMVWFYGDNVHGNLGLEQGLREARRFHRRFREPFIWFDRESVWGLRGGAWPDRHEPRTKRVIAAALDEIKKKYGIAEFVLFGQSAGSHDIAMVLHTRNDVRCAVLGAGPLSLKYLRRVVNPNAPSGWDSADDPIGYVRKVPRSETRRIFIVHDPDDPIVDFHNAEAYLAELRKYGHDAQLVVAKGTSPGGHNVSGTTRRIAMRCMHGLY